MKTDIENNEWKAEAPYLASLSKVNPFSVPEHYFNTLPDLITNSVFAEELKQKIPVSGFIVPDQYFSNSADRFFKGITDRISAETAIDINVGFPKESGFKTPDLYFQQLQAKILARTTGAVAAEESLQENNFAETSSLTVAEISPLAAAERLAEVNSLRVVKHLTTESTLTEESPVQPKPLTKVTRLWHSGLFKYTTAACFILISALGLYLNQQNFQKEAGATEIANEQMLYDINEQDIIDHIQGISPDKQTVSNTDLESYLLNNYSQNELSTAL